ncbi:MAG: hemerythrin domain-containing protein [Betaproteobacteria bacterium]|nr:hemerythrin domain-containing protein [Betaproteobacteria bacterium]
MSTLGTYLTHDHHACDDLFAAAENAVAAGDWPHAQQEFERFDAGMRRHFSMEEDVLFPAFEARTGMSGGPTFVMREEHRQMNNLLAEMVAALARRDSQAYLGQSETLLMLMRQHNMKEENILYPMSDQALADRQSELLAAMEAVTAP